MKYFFTRFIYSFIFLILSLSILFSDFSAGNGTFVDPWQISTASELNAVRLYLGEEFSDQYFIMINNIYLDQYQYNSDEGWEPIGSFDNSFHGNYDGNGFFISGLFIDRPDSDNQGLFGSISGGSIVNTGLINVDITGSDNIGSLVGFSKDESFIENCYSRGVVRGNNVVGGLVGLNRQSEITKSFSTARVSAIWSHAGGLAGSNSWQTAQISLSFSSGEVSGYQYVGGLVGSSHVMDGIVNSYSMGEVSAYTTIVGGLLGTGSGVVNSYWDKETSGQIISFGGSGAIIRTTEQMTYPYSDNTFVDWDFTEVWIADEDYLVNNGYPYLGSIDVVVYLPSPENLSAASENGIISISWELPDYIESIRQDLSLQGFNLYRDGEIINDTLITSYEYDDFDVSIGTEYSYYIIAQYGIGNSSPSDEVEITALGGQYNLSVEVNPQNSGSVTGTEGDFYEGQSVTLEAIPEAGLIFYNWKYTQNLLRNEDVRSIFSEDNPVTFIMPAEDLHLTANFGDGSGFAGGFGTAEDPWQITNLDELDLLRNYTGETHTDKFFILMNDLSFPESPGEPYYNWVPISIDNGFYTNQPFYGTLDGNNHTIYNLFVDQSNAIQNGYAGLFSILRDATVSNLNFENAHIIGGPSSAGVLAASVINSTIINSYSSGSITGNYTTGGLIGNVSQSTTIESCSSAVIVDNTGLWATGGLVGSISSSIILNSSSSGNVTGSRSVGGLVGSLSSGGIIQNSYASGEVIGELGWFTGTGGLVGTSSGLIISSYALGSVDGIQNVGGLAGISFGSIYDSYASGDITASELNCGGLVGLLQEGTINNSYYGYSIVNGGLKVGGLVGRTFNGTINSCYAFSETNGSIAGGLVGESVSSIISNSYSRGIVNGNSIGGLIGLLDSGYVLNSYSRAETEIFYSPPGGLLGGVENDPEIISSYWNTDNPNWEDNDLGEGRTTDEMTYPYADNTYIGWDFVSIWSEDLESHTNQGYPYQLWQDEVTFFYPPVNLTAETDDEVVYLSWDAPEADLTARLDRNLQGYNIFRGGNLLNDELVLETMFTDNNVTNGTIYMYYVVAVYEAGESNPSNILFATPGIPAFSIELTINPVLTGTVTGHEENYTEGESVTLEAFPFTGWAFLNWTYSGELRNLDNPAENFTALRDIFSDENPVIFGMPANDLYLTANFEPVVYFAGGTGAPDDPWQISTADELSDVRLYLGVEFADQHFMLINNIDLDQYPYNLGEGWEPIGSSDHRFFGNFNGNGYVVENLYINRPAESGNGLFGFVEEGHIENLGVINSYITGGLNTGGLVGRLGGGTIENCFTAGTIVAGNNSGGLGGFCTSGTLISNSYSSGYILSDSERVGGLIGFLDDSEITGSFSITEVIGNNNVGGLVGLVHDNSSVNNSFSHGSVYGQQRVGGLVGRNSQSSSITFSYSSTYVQGNQLTGGLVGAGTGQGPTIVSYWNIETSGQTSSIGGTGKLTAEMTFPYCEECYLYWDFYNNWSANQGYPYLGYYDNEVSEIPQPAIELMPPDQSSHTDVLPLFLWKPVLSEKSMNPTGFLISIGTDNPPTNLMDSEDIGWQFSYIPDFELELNQQYFWQIIPYNDFGQVPDSPVWSFSNYSFAGGSGTQVDPWEVETADHLSNLREFLGNSNSDKYFIQTADICLGVSPWNEDEGWEPIGSFDNSFHGNYDGNGFLISGLFIDRPDSDNQGLFGCIRGGSIVNTGLINVEVTGNAKVGSLIGLSENSSFIANCYSRGVINGHTEVGGLVGSNSRSEITGSFSTARVSASWRNAGGLAGSNSWQTAQISQSFSRGDVSGYQNIGGLVGNSNGGIIDCYSIGTVNGSHSVGGLLGSGYGVINSYWDIELSGQTSSDGGDGAIGRTTEEMSFPYSDNTFVDWDFTEVWIADEDYLVNNGYPYLSSINVVVYLPSPENLSGISESGGVNLSWDFPLDYEIRATRQELSFLGFSVYRNGEIVNPVPVLENEYDDYDVSIGTEYTYYVIANYNQGQSYPSNELQITALGDVFSIFVTISPEETGTVTGTEENFHEGQNVTLEAIPEAGLVFYNWTYTQNLLRNEDVRSIFSEDNPVTFTMPANDLHLTANFGDGSGFAGGFGTEEDPWQITNLNELDLLRNYTGETHTDKFFILMNDLSFPESPGEPYYNWVPISIDNGFYTNQPFYGTLEGNNHTIYNLFVDQSEAIQNSYAGLFAVLRYATVSNLNFENVYIIGGPSGSGSLAGYALNTDINNCHSTGVVSGISTAGGLIGGITETTIEDCSSEVNVDNSGGTTGGLIGSMGSNSVINNSSSSGSVTGSSSVGGLVGSLDFGVIQNCHASGEVFGDNYYIGGLVGTSQGSIISSFALGPVDGFNTVGGLVGLSGGSIYDSYASGDVTASNWKCGGLVGWLIEGTISDSFSGYSTVNGSGDVGGLVGNLYNSIIDNCYAYVFTSGIAGTGGLVGKSISSNISNSYSKGFINGGLDLGGLVGFMDSGFITNCYSIVVQEGYSTNSGGLIGNIDNDPLITTSYWNTDNPVWQDNSFGEGRTTDEMIYPYADNTYADWDFEETWLADQYTHFNDGYPFLHWEYSEEEMLPPPTELYVSWGLGYVNLTWDPPLSGANESRTNPPGKTRANSAMEESTLYSYKYDYRDSYELLGYNIYRDNVQINSTLVEQTEYTDYEVTGGAEYNYYVTAVYSLGESIPSQPVTAFPPEIVVDELPWTEDFTGVEVDGLPSGWQRTHSNWGVIDTNNAGGDIPEIRFHLIPYSSGLFRLTSPMIDVSGCNSFELHFKHSLNHITEDYDIKVEITSDLSNWETVWAVNVTGNIEPETVEINVSGINYESIYVSWVFIGNSWHIWDWFIDDVELIPHEQEFAGGSGTAEDPWQIETAEHFGNLNNYLGEDHSDKHFELINDIDMSAWFYYRDGVYFDEEGWIPIGVDYSNAFKGYFNGNYYIIDGLYIDRPDSDFQGLFGYIEGAVITNVGLTNVNITGNCYVGALVGESFWSSSVINCFSTGFVSGEDNVGGLIGAKGDFASLENSFSKCTVIGDYFVGGLIGSTYHADLSNSYSRGDVTGSAHVGGLIGVEGSSQITNCFSTGNVSGNVDSGGLIGHSMGSFIENSYWDIQTSGQSTSDGGEGRTTDEMTYPYCTYTFAGWDFESIWIADENYHFNSGYPYLFWQHTDIAVLYPPLNLTATAEIGSITLTWDEPLFEVALANNYSCSEQKAALQRVFTFNDSDTKKSENLHPKQNRDFNQSRRNRNLLGYNLYRNSNQINTEVVNIREYQDYDIVPGATYEYYVTALYDQGESGPSVPVEITSSEFIYGDIDRNGEVQPADASVILQYYVGLDPIPDIDPSPWSPLSVTIADVDGNGQVQPADASLILQFYVGIIDAFPVEESRSFQMDPGTVEVVINDGKLDFYADVSVYGLGIDISPEYSTYLANPENFNSSWFFAQNISCETFRIAGAVMEPEEKFSLIFSIPFIDLELSEIELSLQQNDMDPKIITVYCSNLENNSDKNEMTALYSNYPNPFNPDTRIEFSIQQPGRVTIEVYNIMGQKIRLLVDDYLESGIHSVVWDGKGPSNKEVGSGIYLYRIKTNGFSSTKKMLLIK